MSLSRRRNLVVRASPMSSPNSWRERWTQKEKGRLGIELVAQILNLPEPETSPLFVPIERRSRVIQEFACRQFGRMLSVKDSADNIRRHQRETEQPRRIGRDYISDLAISSDVRLLSARIRSRIIWALTRTRTKLASGVMGSDPSSTISFISLPTRLRRTGIVSFTKWSSVAACVSAVDST